MADDPALRAARLGLLATVRDLGGAACSTGPSCGCDRGGGHRDDRSVTSECPFSHFRDPNAGRT